MFGDSSNEFGQVVNSDLQIANRGRRDEFVNKKMADGKITGFTFT